MGPVVENADRYGATPSKTIARHTWVDAASDVPREPHDPTCEWLHAFALTPPPPTPPRKGEGSYSPRTALAMMLR
jgi:hypothetical protein